MVVSVVVVPVVVVVTAGVVVLAAVVVVSGLPVVPGASVSSPQLQPEQLQSQPIDPHSEVAQSEQLEAKDSNKILKSSKSILCSSFFM